MIGHLSRPVPLDDLAAQVDQPPSGGLIRGAQVIGALIVVMGVMGIADRIHPGGFRRWDLDQEGTVPAAFSGLLDEFAGLTALSVWAHRDGGRLMALLIPAFIYVGFDEVFSFHENLENATGINSDIWLSPLPVLGFLGFIGVLRDWQRWRPSQVLLTIGGALWGVSQVFELVGHSVGFYGNTHLEAPHYAWWMVSEELMEMTGSACFLFASLYIIRTHGPVREVLGRQLADVRARLRA